MKEQEIKELVKNYIKDNLTIQIATSIQDYYGRQKDHIEIKLFLGEEEISRSEDSL